MTVVYRQHADVDTLPIELDADQRDRWTRLLQGPVASLHDHPVRLPVPLTGEQWQLHVDERQGTDVLAGHELAGAGYQLIYASSLSEPNFDTVLRWADSFRAQLEAIGFRIAERGDVFESGTSTVVLALEDLVPIGDDLSKLDQLAAIGVRSAGLSYNTGSALGAGLSEERDTGLTALGVEAVSIMNELGMAVDVSHASDRCALEAAEITTRPLLLTHAGARACWPTSRMKSDEVIRAVSGTGGLIGIEAAPGSTRTRANRAGHDLEDYIAHVEYCAELVGVDNVALGPDTFYGDHVSLYGAAGWKSAPVPWAVALDIDLVAGVDNPTEVPRQVAAALIRRGWGDDDIAAVLGGNAIRVTREILSPCSAQN